MMQKVKVVIRWSTIFSLWYICHAKSYQNAFRAKINGFKTREEAATFAIQKGCEVEKHKHDDLQNY